MGEQTEINGAKLQLYDSGCEQMQHQYKDFYWTFNRFNQWVDVGLKMFF